MRDSQGIRPSQHGFMKVGSCLTSLISFYDQVTPLVDRTKAVDVVYLEFSKALDTVSHSILWKSWQPIAQTGALFTGWVVRPR